MIKKIGLGLVATICLAATGAANASLMPPIVDVVDNGPNGTYVGWFGSHSWTHDITDAPDFFDPDGPYDISGGTLAIEVWDDGDAGEKCLFGFCTELPDLEIETIVFTVEAFDFDTGGITLFAQNWSTELEPNAIQAVNADGMLDVKVQNLLGLGDFYVGKSVLTLDLVHSDSASVPEPGVLALLGLGLLGLRLARPRV